MSTIAQRYTLPAIWDVVQLHYVRAIARSASMTAAAAELRVSQPTLSNAIRGLERRLGTTLFLRGPRGVTPTAAGLSLVRAADAVVALLHQASDEIRGIETATAGRFTIGCYHSFGSFFLPPLLRDLAERAPGIDLALWEGIGPRVVDAVIDRTVQFGLGVASAAPARPHPDLVVVPMFRDAMVVVSARRTPPPSAPLFHVPRVAASERVVEALRARGRLPARVVPCGDLELVKQLVLERAGIGVMPWRVAIQGTARGALRLADPKLPHEVDVGCLFYRADLHRTRAALLLRDELLRRGRALDALALPGSVRRIGTRARSATEP